MLQQSTRRGDYEMFKQYTEMVDEEGEKINLRGQLDFNFPKKSVPLDEVESVDSIVTRFKTGAMSYGSISKEAHETMAIAMNMLHGKSNSGEGGEDIERLDTNRCSAIKQVASGRFGVTTAILQIQSAVLVVSVLKKLQKITLLSIQKHSIRLDCRLI